MAIIALKGAPETAFATACSIAHVVKTVVGRPMQVAIVKGLNRNLIGQQSVTGTFFDYQETYNAATTGPLHLLSFLGEVKSADEPASPDSAIVIKALALRRSTVI